MSSLHSPLDVQPKHTCVEAGFGGLVAGGGVHAPCW